MPKEASDTAHSTPQGHDEVVATVLSMTLDRKAKARAPRVPVSPPANAVDDADDLWDNVPV